MAIKKRLVHVGKNTTTLETLKKTTATENPYLHSISFYAGNDATADILTHGESYVQAPLNAREEAISGVDAGSISSTNVAKILANDQIKGGITLNNLNTAINLLNAALTSSETDTLNKSKVTLKQVAAADVEEGWAAQYQLYQGYDSSESGDDKFKTPVGVKINIPKDQFLKEAKYITTKDTDDNSDTATKDKVTYPALRFTWQLSDHTGTTGETDSTGANTDAITYVSVKDLVDTYVGYTNTLALRTSSVTKVQSNTVDGSTKVSSAVTDTTLNGANDYVVTTSMVEASGVNGDGKGIKVELSNSIIDALDEGANALANAKVYADNKKQEVENNTIGKGLTVFTGLGAVSGSGTEATPYVRAVSTTGTLGGTETSDPKSVVEALDNFLTAIESNADDILALKNNGAALAALLESLQVQSKEFPDADETTGKRNLIIYGDEVTLDETAFGTAGANTVENDSNRAATVFNWTKATDITSALLDLASAWEWAEIAIDGTTTYVI